MMPEGFVKERIKKAKEYTFFGTPLIDLYSEELLAVCVELIDELKEHQEYAMKKRDYIMGLRKT